MLKKQYSKSKPICTVTFSLPLEAAPGASEVKVLGDFNDWSWENGIEMHPKGTDYTAKADFFVGKAYRFRYLIDGQTWENDHQADRYEPSQFADVYNSVLVLEEQGLTEESAEKAAAKAQDTVKKAAKAVAKKAKAATAKPKKAKKATKKAKKSKKESLRKIEGIGPKIEGLLHEVGIITFDDLAKAKVAKVKEILAKAGSRYKMHDPTTWTEQAALAAAGKWDELAVLQEELKGGKRK
jgi:predicted flap endonuclease-1-like 5' DNA nuclease